MWFAVESLCRAHRRVKPGLNKQQISEIEKGLAEADAGDFATEEEMQQTIRRLTRRAR
jgi:predicted transcriptional regulator